MIELIWEQPQLESSEPQILEEFDDYSVIHLLENSREYLNKYQIWVELEKMLSLVKDRTETIEYLKVKL